MDLNRKTAYEILLEVEKNEAYSNLAMNRFIRKNAPDKEAFVRELVYGVLENKILLDYYLDALIPSGIKKVKARELTLLRMGLYQLIYMDSVPEYAAVSETVNMAKQLARGREKFINGVLRGYSKKKTDIHLPDPQKEPIRYLSIAYSVREWIVKLWLDTYGYAKTEEILAAANRAPQLSARINRMKTDTKSLAEELEKDGFAVESSDKTERGIFLSGSRLLESEAYRQGQFSIQDIASIMTSDILGAKPGDTVIDVCAAPGGKTAATAEMMENQGRIIAMDVYEHKLALIHEQAERCGIDIIETKCHDSTEAIPALASKADCVLCDVPCSGLGVIAGKPEIKYRENPDFAELTERQEKILSASATYVKAGGTLVYSTCTINKEENEKQIERFLLENKDFAVEKQLQLLPTDGTDGFFICKLIKTEKNRQGKQRGGSNLCRLVLNPIRD